jgi:hypothetical protein
VRDLKDLRALARTTLYDIGACTEEIIEFAKKEAGYRWNVLEMARAREAGAGEASLLRALRSSQRSRAKQIQREASLLQSTLSTSNELSQAISIARIQRILVLLTLISVGVALYVGVLQ